MMEKLPKTEIERRLQGLNGWRLDGSVITKDFKFKDFATAWDFMNQVAVVADKELNHHPEWSNVYNQVTIKLTTHDAGGLTDKDFDLAQRADEIASSIIS